MGKWKHRLLLQNPKNRKGLCANCGEVRLRSKGNNKWRCYNSIKFNKEAHNKRNTKYRLKHYNQIMSKKLYHRYKITIEEKEALLKKQSHKCAICLQPSTRLVVDHDHETGVVRALLCSGCNIGIGFAKENPFILQRMIKYLKKNKSPNFEI